MCIAPPVRSSLYLFATFSSDYSGLLSVHCTDADKNIIWDGQDVCRAMQVVAAYTLKGGVLMLLLQLQWHRQAKKIFDRYSLPIDKLRNFYTSILL